MRSVAFKVYDIDRDGFISNGELFLVLKMMVGNNLKVRWPCVLVSPRCAYACSHTRTSNYNRSWIKVRGVLGLNAITTAADARLQQ